MLRVISQSSACQWECCLHSDNHNIGPEDVEAPHVLVPLLSNDGDMIFKIQTEFFCNKFPNLSTTDDMLEAPF